MYQQWKILMDDCPCLKESSQTTTNNLTFTTALLGSIDEATATSFGFSVRITSICDRTRPFQGACIGEETYS